MSCPRCKANTCNWFSGRGVPCADAPEDCGCNEVMLCVNHGMEQMEKIMEDTNLSPSAGGESTSIGSGAITESFNCNTCNCDEEGKLACEWAKTTPNEDVAMRFNEGKPEFSYIFSAPYAMEGICEAWAFGATKYERDNWKKGFPSDQLIDSMLRHLMKWTNGEVNDPETGINHLNHVLWNAMALADQYNGKRDGNKSNDNR